MTLVRRFQEDRVKAAEMKPGPKFLLALALILAADGRVRSQDCRGLSLSEGKNLACTSDSIPAAAEPSALGNHRRVTRYATGFDGDHSLDAAIVAEQVFSRYSLYTVRLQFASGAEQSISVVAPPGGLQLEMRDMSGDSVPNDLVLTSKLLRLPLVVLLNEGHDHLTVAGSPGSFSPDEEGRTSGTREVHHISVLASHGFRLAGLVSSDGFFPPQLQAHAFSPVTVRFTCRSTYFSRSGRAPPCS